MSIKQTREIIAYIAFAITIWSTLGYFIFKYSISIPAFVAVLSIPYLLYVLIKDVILNYRYIIKSAGGKTYLARSYTKTHSGSIQLKTLFNSLVETSSYEITDLDGE